MSKDNRGKFTKKEFEEWSDKAIKKEVENICKLAEPIVSECVLDAEREFRRAFIKKLGEKGMNCWKEVFEKHFEEIVRILRKNYEKEVNFTKGDKKREKFSGVLPPGTRFTWHREHRGHKYDLFCIEQRPTCRSVDIAGKFYKLAFPWTRFFFLFRDGNLCPTHGNWYHFYVFFGTRQIVDENDELLLTNLPHTDYDWPHPFCIGHSLLTKPLNNPKWYEMLEEYFWSGRFSGYGVNQNGWLLSQSVCERMPAIQSLCKWENLSNENPNKILKLPWPSTEKTIKETADSIFGVAFRQSGQNDDSEDDKEVLSDPERVRLLEKFHEGFEESISFLAEHFAVNPDLKKAAVKVLEKRLREAEPKLLASLKMYIAGLAKSYAKNAAAGRRSHV